VVCSGKLLDAFAAATGNVTGTSGIVMSKATSNNFSLRAVSSSS